MLPVRNFDPAFTRHFVTPHDADTGALARAFGVRHQKVSGLRDCEEALREAIQRTGVDILEIPLERDRSTLLRRAVLLDTAEAVDRDVATALPAPEHHAPAFPLTWRRLCREGTGVPVVFLHGFTRSAHSWSALAETLPTRPMLAVDLPGHGDSPSPDDMVYFGLESTADRLSELLDRLHYDRVHLVGYSLGARAAAVFAAMHESRLASLTLLSGTPGIENSEERKTRKREDAMLAATIEEGGLEAFVENWMQSPLFSRLAATRVEDVRLTRRERMGQHSHGLARSLRSAGQGSMQPVWELLASFTMPVLLVAGDRDLKYTALAEKMRGALPNARLETVPDAGHDVVLEGQQALAELLPSFWSESETGAADAEH
jgi:2-succinyl-6-hydroxy-2,4-cyclohexadiene-1-carboxylate synthase